MRFRSRFVIGTALVVAAIGYLITTAIRTTSEYYLTVNEVGARQAELGGQAMRVAGRVKPGTIAWDPSTLTLKFGIVPIPDPNADPAVKQVSTAEPASFSVSCRRAQAGHVRAPAATLSSRASWTRRRQSPRPR